MHPSRKGIEFKAILFFKLDKKRQVGYKYKFKTVYLTAIITTIP